MDADGQNPIRLTENANGEERFFDVSPDGDQIFYAVPNDRKEMQTFQVSINVGKLSIVADDYRTSGATVAAPDGRTLMHYVYLPESDHS